MGMDIILTGGEVLAEFKVVGVTDTEVAGFKKGEKELIVLDKEAIELVIQY